MANENSDGLLGVIVLCFGFVFTVLYIIFVLPFKSQKAIQREEEAHRNRMKISHRW